VIIVKSKTGLLGYEPYGYKTFHLLFPSRLHVIETASFGICFRVNNKLHPLTSGYCDNVNPCLD
jgi:hypothetical protein